MVQRSGGFRRKTRGILKKKKNDKGKISIKNYLQGYNKGDRICLVAEPAVQKGMHFPKFNGKSGVIQDKRGNCYEILIKDGGKEKLLIVHPVHLRRI